MRTRIVVLLAWSSAVLAGGCAGRSLPPAQHILASDLGTRGTIDPTRPVVIELRPGDVIPLTIVVGGPLIATPEGLEPIRLTVQRRFYLRVDGQSGVRTSLDGEHFGERPMEPGTFRFGVDVTREGVGATFSIRTPTHAEPEVDRP